MRAEVQRGCVSVQKEMNQVFSFSTNLKTLRKRKGFLYAYVNVL